MTDNEIIKALECCANDGCQNCTFDGCTGMLLDEGVVLDLINRQKAEIERLHIEGLQINKIFMDFVNKQTAKAIKEFAERLKKEMYTVGFDIDNLVKEMVGDE